jgi:dTDP-4-dehydrorhamnose reductase
MVRSRAPLREAGPQLGVEVVLLGRPGLDLAAPETIGRAMTGAAPNIVVNAAAYTAVDQAEREPQKANAARVHRIELPSWRSSLRSCLERLSSEVDQALRS